MVGWNSKSELISYDAKEENEKGNVTMELYIRKMLKTVKRYRDEAVRKKQGFIFQEDNDSGHSTASLDNPTLEYKVKIDLDFIDDWPSNSPDLSPVENIWRILKQRAKRRCPESVDELKQIIQKEWDKIT
jgi:transposase